VVLLVQRDSDRRFRVCQSVGIHHIIGVFDDINIGLLRFDLISRSICDNGNDNVRRDLICSLSSGRCAQIYSHSVSIDDVRTASASLDSTKYELYIIAAGSCDANRAIFTSMESTSSRIIYCPRFAYEHASTVPD